MEELLDLDMPDTGTENILYDTHIEETVDAETDIFGCEQFEIDTHSGENVFRTDVFDVDDKIGLHGDSIYRIKDDSEFLISGDEVCVSDNSTIIALENQSEGLIPLEDDNFLAPINIPQLDVPQDDIEALRDRAAGIEREIPNGNAISFGAVCRSRHGCTGATYCDNCLSDYPY